MVDSINGAGGPPPIQNTNRVQSKTAQTREQESSAGAAAQDEVSISTEALDLAEAERAADNARAELENDQNAVLTRGQDLSALL